MFPAEIKIRDLRIRPATILAPMAGVTDTVFRRVIRSLGPCGLIMTEFTSAEGLTRKAARTLRYLYFDEDERPIAAQIFGSDPVVMASAAALDRGPRFRPRGHQSRLPGQESGEVRRLGFAARSSAPGKALERRARRGSASR